MLSFFKKHARVDALSPNWAEEEHLRTEQGRVFGWWLRLRGVRVAELNYRRWDNDGQFWHEYYVVPISAQFDEIGFDPNRWCENTVSAESRYCIGYIQEGILMSPRADGVVNIRSLSIPKEIFTRTLVALLQESEAFRNKNIS